MNFPLNTDYASGLEASPEDMDEVIESIAQAFSAQRPDQEENREDDDYIAMVDGGKQNIPPKAKHQPSLLAFAGFAPTGGSSQQASAPATACSRPGNVADPTPRSRDHAAERRKRKVKSDWFKPYGNWLRELEEPVSKKNVLFCNRCSIIHKKMSLLSTSLDTIKKHEKSVKHMLAEEKYSKLPDAPEFVEAAKVELAKRKKQAATNAGENQKTLVATFRDGAPVADQKEFERKLIQFMLVFGLLKHHRPMTDFEWLQKLLAVHPVVQEVMPLKHLTDNSGWEIADSFDAVLVEDMQQTLKDCDFFSITIDASAAVNHVDYLDVEVRLWHNNELRLLFIGMEEVGLETTAEQQEELLLKCLSDFAEVTEDVLKKKLVAMAADGCNTMQGHQNGLLTRIQKRCPHMLKINCNAHKVNLAAEILDQFPWFKRISDVVREVATYVRSSPRRTAQLVGIQEKLQLPKLNALTVNDTRWMPIYKAMKNLMAIYPSVLSLFLQRRETDSTARMLLHEMTCPHVLLGMYAVESLLNQLQILTKVVQGRHLYPGDVAIAVETCKRNITGRYEENANRKINFKELFELSEFNETSLLTKSSNGTLHIRVGTTTVELKELPKPDESMQHVPLDQLPKIKIDNYAHYAIKKAAELGQAVVRELTRRLPKTEIMEALCLVTPRYWIDLGLKYHVNTPQEDLGKMYSEPLKLLKELIYQFGEEMPVRGGGTVPPLLDQAKLLSQYSDFQQYMKKESMKLWETLKSENARKEPTDRLTNNDLLKEAGGELVESFWGRLGVNLGYIDEFLRLVGLILSVPFGSVENERRFSSMNLSMTKLRNRLQKQHLNACLRLASTAYTVLNFNFWLAFVAWKAKERRGASL
ncbi:hypothetical protein Ndes2526A_g07807 [Nannochloris sp. 'desiccata']